MIAPPVISNLCLFTVIYVRVSDLKWSIQCRKKRMIQNVEDLSLSTSSMYLQEINERSSVNRDKSCTFQSDWHWNLYPNDEENKVSKMNKISFKLFNTLFRLSMIPLSIAFMAKYWSVPHNCTKCTLTFNISKRW